MKTSHITAMLLAIPAFAGAALAAESPVYPCPQECNLQKQYTRASTVKVEIRSPKSKGKLWQSIPADKEGAYAISITPGKVLVRANDEVGVHYAKQTLSQLLKGVKNAKDAQRDPFPDKSLEQVAKLGQLPVGEIIDWPDLPFRGTVEGYYGAPWSLEARKAQFDFYGRNKMNMYIYAPKDDPYHHGRGCYQPYPKEKAREIAELVQYARKNHVRFVWAIHPANTVNWNKNGGKDDLNALCDKLELMYDLGVRDFGVFVDDAFGEIGKATRQVELCNYLMENFIRKHKDVNQEIIMCPTGYNRAWTNKDYLSTLGNNLDKNIHIMWTGDTVVHDITLDGQRWVNQYTKRPTFIWWNWPVNDYKRSRLSMGRTYGLGQEEAMNQEMSGFVSNPMEQAETSKVGLFSVADYTWNIQDFDSVESWQEGIRRMFPQSHEAMQVFCNHNAYLLPNAHSYVREESVDMAEPAKKFREALSRGTVDTAAAKTLQTEFVRMYRAGKILESAKDAKPVHDEVAPWISKFRYTGEAGACLLSAMTEDSAAERNKDFFRAVSAMNNMKRITRLNWAPNGVNKVRDVEVSMLVMTPTMNDAYDYMNLKIYSDISGKPAQTVLPDFICNGGNAKNGSERMRDGNPNSFWDSGIYQAEGHWYGYDFKEPTQVRTINLVMGGPRAKDYIGAGQLEYTVDGKTWKPIGEETEGPSVVKDFGDKPITARMIRYRITKARPNWLTICEFTVNKNLPAMATSTIAGRQNLSTFRDNKMVGINRVMEVDRMKPGQYVELSVPAPVQATWLEINFENKDIRNWGTVEVTLEDGSVVKPQFRMEAGVKLCCSGPALPKKRIKSMRLTNTSDKVQDVKFTMFKMDVPPVDPDASVDSLTDASFMTAYSCDNNVQVQLDVPEDATAVTVVGDAVCSIDGASDASVAGNLRTFTLKKGTKTIKLKADKQPGKWINEVIFK